MNDKENVIKGLEHEISRANIPTCGTDFIDCVEVALLRDALDLLKAQEPRVMTIAEADAINGGDPVWIEDRSLDQMILGIKFQSPSKSCYYVMLIGSKRPQPFSKELYLINWRIWTSRPTDAQREAIPWEG